MNNNDSYVFYASYFLGIMNLPAELQLEAFIAFCAYAFNGIEYTGNNSLVNAVFQMAKPTIDANIKRRTNGKLGGRPRKTKKSDETNGLENKNHRFSKDKTTGNASAEPNVNVNGNDNVYVNACDAAHTQITDCVRGKLDEYLAMLEEMAGTPVSEAKRNYVTGDLLAYGSSEAEQLAVLEYAISNRLTRLRRPSVKYKDNNHGHNDARGMERGGADLDSWLSTQVISMADHGNTDTDLLNAAP